MKKVIVSALMLISTTVVCAQTFAEWFRQKATQKKYLLQQIAALKVYEGYLSKGYQIARSGLHTIGNIKHGDFNLHDTYFNSLKTISPKLRNYQKVAIIVLMQAGISRQAASCIQFCRNSGQLTPDELLWLQTTSNSLLADGATNLKALSSIVTNGEYSMKDNERLARIDQIYNSMLDNKTFCSSFSNACRGLCMQRKNEQFEIQQSQKLNGLK